MVRALFTSPHFFKMLGYFAVATALTLLLGFSISTGSLLAGLACAVIVSGVGMSFGLGSTIFLRSYFSLMQTGRFVQYACFLFGTLIGVRLAAALVGSLVVSSSALTALTIFVIAFGAATLTGEVPTKGRTWMPVRRPF